MRCNLTHDLTLDTLVGRLSIFELDNFDNYAPSSNNLQSAFKEKLTLDRKGGNSKGKQDDSEEEEEPNEDLEVIEGLLEKRATQGKGKFRGKISFIFSHVRKLVTLLQGVQKRKIKMTKGSTSSKVRNTSKATRNTKAKVRNHVTLQKILIVIMMKIN